MDEVGNENYLKQIAGNLSELVKWSKFSGKLILKNLVKENLKTELELEIYELSDGKRSTRDISKILGATSHTTVAVSWKKWRKLGIVETSSQFQGRYKHICPLEELGIEVPNLPKGLSEERKSDEEAID